MYINSHYTVIKNHFSQWRMMLKNYIMFNFMIFTLLLLCFIKKQDSHIISSYPKLIIIGFGYMFSVLACKIQISTIGKGEFEQFTRGNIISLLVLYISIAFYYFLNVNLIDYSIAFFIIVNMLTWFTFGYKLSHELSKILKVNILTVGDRRNEK